MATITSPVEVGLFDYTIDFDWYDDHSSWRIESLQPELAKAINLLNKAGGDEILPTDLDGIRKLYHKLRSIYKDHNFSDQDVRSALIISDEIYTPEDVESFDASDSYDFIIEDLKERIANWQSSYYWVYSQDKWDVDLIKEFSALQEARNGLGERFKFKFQEKEIEFSDGTTYFGVNPSEELISAFEALTIHDWLDSEFPLIIELLVNEEISLLQKVERLANELSSVRELSSTHSEANMMLRACKQVPDHLFESLLETITSLSDNWSSSNLDLIEAALELI